MFKTIMEISPKNGGKDAENFAQELTNSITKMLRSQGATWELSSATEQEKSYRIKTDMPPRNLAWLEGYHTIQRIPKGSSARHTSNAIVVVRELGKKSDHITLDMNDVRIDRYRGRGKGGQRKNKVSTAIRVVHEPTGITITRETGRNQKENLDSALTQLAHTIDTMNGKNDSFLIDHARQEVHETKERGFTHNMQRSEVTAHAYGKKWTTKHWKAGKAWISS